jgi:hypothetical protein
LNPLQVCNASLVSTYPAQRPNGTYRMLQQKPESARPIDRPPEMQLKQYPDAKPVDRTDDLAGRGKSEDKRISPTL